MSVSDKKCRIIAKIIRIATLPPLAALTTLSIFLFCNKISLAEFLIGSGCLCVLPIVSYAVEPLLRKKDVSKRDSQRNLAVLFSVAGYALCNALAWILQSSDFLKTFYLTYMFSVLTILVLGKAFHIRCSGHACGFVGPLVFLGCFVSSWYFLGLALLAGLVWASMRIERHTFSELAIGSVIPVVSLGIAYLLIIQQIFVFVGEQVVTML